MQWGAHLNFEIFSGPGNPTARISSVFIILSPNVRKSPDSNVSHIVPSCCRPIVPLNMALGILQ